MSKISRFLLSFCCFLVTPASVCLPLVKVCVIERHIEGEGSRVGARDREGASKRECSSFVRNGI